jgi:hypothetical protein
METPEKKVINILYTHKEPNGNFLPNGNELGVENTIFSDGGNFISTHICGNDMSNTRNITISREYITSYDRKKTYFYIISHPSLSLNEILEQKFPVNENIIRLSKKQNNIYIVFLYEHEPDNEDLFPKLIRYLDYYKLDSSKVIIINNNANIYQIPRHYQIDIQVHKSGFLAFSSYRVLSSLKVNFVEDKKGKFFLCRNRGPKQHRLALILYLYINNLIEDVNYSFVPEIGSRHSTPYGYLKFFKTSLVKKNEELVNYINSHTKLDDYEKDLNWINPETNYFSHQDDLPPIFLVPELSKSFENSYFNIVTESVFDYPGNVTHVTEKSFRPFYYYQFPIFVATNGHVNHLRNHYGFDVFDDVISHEYDNEYDTKKRMELVVSEIKRINENKEFFIDFYKNNKERFIKNQEKYKEIALESKEEDFNFFWNLI